MYTVSANSDWRASSSAEQEWVRLGSSGWQSPRLHCSLYPNNALKKASRCPRAPLRLTCR